MCSCAFFGGRKRVVTSREDEKRAANEATFRDANERIRAIELELGPPLERVPYLCECDDLECRELMPLTALEYERIREDGATFGVLRGHDSDGVVIEEHERYLVVRKPAGGGDVARALDPRREDARERRAG
jgi:hypothetical protein